MLDLNLTKRDYKMTSSQRVSLKSVAIREKRRQKPRS